MAEQKIRLDDSQRKLLEWLGTRDVDGDPAREFQFNSWIIPAEWEGVRLNPRDLVSLARRGLVEARGRGLDRQWWITEKGLEAIA
jgi:hypothetical protein